MKLTATEIKAAKPKEKAYKLSDGGGMYLEIFPNGTKSWRLKYRIGGKEKRVVFGVYAGTINDVTRAIGITTTQAGYGVRIWYVCPHCGTRAAKLYIGKKDIACRKCWKLHYASQSEDQLTRMRRDIRRQRYAIWGNTKHTRNLAHSPHLFAKPKGMRWEAFDRKVARLIRCELAYWQAFTPVVDRIIGRCR